MAAAGLAGSMAKAEEPRAAQKRAERWNNWVECFRCIQRYFEGLGELRQRLVLGG